MNIDIEEILKFAIRRVNLICDKETKSTIKAKLLAKQDIFKSKNARVSVCGRFNAGKSAFINALLRDKIVISKAIPATGVITRIHYRDSIQFKVIKNIYGEIVESSFNSSDISKFTVKNNFNNNDDVKNIERVEIGIPNDFLRTGIELFDTPGIDDSKEMDEITFKQLDESDFVIFVIDALQVRSIEDLVSKYYKYLGRNVIFVINRMDMADNEFDRDEIKDLAQTYFAEYFNTVSFSTGLFYVSSNVADPDVKTVTDFFRAHMIENSKRIALISRVSIIKYECEKTHKQLKNKIKECDEQLKSCSLTERKELKEKRVKYANDRKIVGELISYLIDKLSTIQINN